MTSAVQRSSDQVIPAKLLSTDCPGPGILVIIYKYEPCSNYTDHSCAMENEVGGGGVRQQNNCPNQVPIVVSCCRCFESVTLFSDGSYMYNSTKLTGIIIQHSLTESTYAN